MSHNYESEITTQATCGKEGIRTYTCTNCDDTYTETIAAMSHSFTNYVSNNDATCTEDGTKTAICNNCNIATDTKVDEGSKLGHDYVVTTTTATCTEEGITTYTCSRCGHTYTETTPALGHSFTNYISDNNATCYTDGTKTAICDNGCGEKDTIQDIGSKLTHDYKQTDKKDATCTEEGYIEYTCSKCSDTYKETIKVLAHDYVVTTTTATCTEIGTTIYTCARCGHTYTETAKELGHDYVESSRVPPTCTEEGYIEYVCTRCGDSYNEVLKPTGHKFVDGKCEYCGELEDKPNEDKPNEEKPEEDKKDDTTSGGNKLPQTGINNVLTLTGVFAANAVGSVIMMKKKENE